MSALGQKQTSEDVKAMSALPPKADITKCDWNVRYVPKADICSAANSSLFDHLVGASKHRLRNCEFYCFGSLEIDYKLVLRRRLHGKIGWLLTFEDAIDVASSAVEQVDGVRPIGDQATSGDEVSVKKDRRQLVSIR